MRTVIFWFFLFFFALGPVYLITLFSSRRQFIQKVIAFFVRILFGLIFLKVEVSGKRHLKEIDPAKGLLIVANHQSFLDTFILLANLPFPFRLVVHPVGFKFKPLGFFYKKLGYIGLSMKRHKTGAHLFSLFSALKNKEKILVYSVKEFEFTPILIELSKRFDTPILPVSIRGSSKIMPIDKRFLGPGKVYLNIGKPRHFPSLEELKNEVLSLHASF